MRALKVCVPKELSPNVLDVIFRHGVGGAVVHSVEFFGQDGTSHDRVVIDIETSTPKAKAVSENLIASDFFDAATCSMSTRQPRAIVSSESYAELTKPWVEPSEDICQELWQFSHITAGLVGRILIGGGLLAYGVINQELLMMIAGMLFLPLVPMLLGMGVGLWTRQWDLAARAAGALSLSLALLFVSGVAVAMLSQPPLMYSSFNSISTSLAISFAVGIAAALATSDDGGRRELIGLAAAAQIAVKPVWLGAASVLGQPVELGQSHMASEALTLLLNILSIIAASSITYVAIGVVHVHRKRAAPKPVSTGIQSAQS